MQVKTGDGSLSSSFALFTFPQDREQSYVLFVNSRQDTTVIIISIFYTISIAIRKGIQIFILVFCVRMGGQGTAANNDPVMIEVSR